MSGSHRNLDTSINSREIPAEEIVDVLVVGAGPAGAVSALLLARAGLSVRLVERKNFPRRKVCGACLSEAATNSLADIGLDDVLRTAVPLNSFRLASRGRSATIPLQGGCVLSREALDSELVAAAVKAGAGFEDGVSADIGPAESFTRSVALHPTTGDATRRVVKAKTVVFAGGLAGSAFRHDPALRSHPILTAHVGAGAEWRNAPPFYGSGTIDMATHRAGYAGLTRTEAGTLNIAVAIQPRFVNACGGLGPAVEQIVREAGFPSDDLASLDWTGTPPLTRRPAAVAAERLFLVGDAAGYVEPFTGEGIGWAIGAARALSPIVRDAVRREWSQEHAERWAEFSGNSVRSRQRICRTIARGLRSEILVLAAIRLLQPFPQAARPVLRHLATG